MNLNKCIEVLKKDNVDAMLLLNEANMHYVCGFSPSEGMILITAKGKSYHIVDSRYTETAQIHSKENGLCVVEIDDTFINILHNKLSEENIKTLYYENETISLKAYTNIKSKVDFAELLPLDKKVMQLRNVKDSNEIELIKKANSIAEKSFIELLNFVKAGKSEKELCAYFDYLMAINGSDGVSFDTILLTGSHTSMPHGVPDERLVCEGDFILFDFGATYKGYHSDMTRTVAVKYATDEMLQDYTLVKKAQFAGINALKANTKCSTVYKAAFDVLEEKDKAKYFRHSLGHGIGLEIHEGYTASPNSNDIFEIGNVTSIEPGIYIPDKYGIRIEDMLYISPEGTQNLSNISKELIIL